MAKLRFWVIWCSQGVPCNITKSIIHTGEPKSIELPRSEHEIRFRLANCKRKCGCDCDGHFVQLTFEPKGTSLLHYYNDQRKHKPLEDDSR